MDNGHATESVSQDQPNYSERISHAKQEAGKKIFEKKQESNRQKFVLNDFERKLATQTLSLINDPAFKSYLEGKNHFLADRFGKIFEPVPEQWFKPTNTGEAFAFQNGFIKGMQVIDLEFQRLWKIVMDEQANAAQKGE